VDVGTGKVLSLRESFERGVGFATRSGDFEKANVKIIENNEVEILEVVREMIDRQEGVRTYDEYENKLQSRFLEVYEKQVRLYEKLVNKKFHGEIRARYSSDQLVRCPEWIEM
jgi:hypothetical protein